MSTEIRTTCPYCGVGCGVIARPDGAGGWRIAGDPAHPANFGQLCSKGSSLAETLGPENRLSEPKLYGQSIDWDGALEVIAHKIRGAIATHGPDSVAVYGSGQMLTEDYYAANKFVKGVLGTANIDTNSRLCMASAVAAYKRGLGEDVVPQSYEDLDLADLIVLVGSNTAWCHPVLWRRIEAARERRDGLPRLVVIDPRRTATAEAADLHLPIIPGADAILFNGLFHWLAGHGVMDRAYVAHHTNGLDAALAAAAQAGAPAEVAAACGLEPAAVLSFFKLFADTEKTVTAWSQGLNQSASGTDKGNAILNVHLLTGRIGKPGAGPFSLTGQPNAMGGREVGGLANQLAAHLDLNDPADRDRLARFWGTPQIAEKPGLSAVALFEAAAAGRIQVLWICATNPLASLPDGATVAAALSRVPFVIVADYSPDSVTAQKAHLLLPAAAWSEKDGTVTNSERRISRQRPFRPAPDQAKPDWWMFAQVAARLGYADKFAWDGPGAIFAEHAALSGFENGGARVFDISGLVDVDFDRLEPIQWPVPAGSREGTARLFAGGRFAKGLRATFIPVTPRPPVHPLTETRPLQLLTARVRDHWHTLTRTGRAPTLGAHRPEPVLEIHPDDAARFGLTDGALAEIETDWGLSRARVAVVLSQRPGSICLPMHWNGAFAQGGAACAQVNPAIDPVSGQPELKATPASVRPFASDWQGLVIAPERLNLPFATYCVTARVAAGWRHVIAGTGPVEALSWRQSHGGVAEAWSEITDPALGLYRAAGQRADGRAEIWFIAGTAPLPDPPLPDADIAEQVLAAQDPGPLARLAGRTGTAGGGRLICACHGVTDRAIRAAIDDGAGSVGAVGAMTGAGTGCGSCRSEIRTILAAASRVGVA